MGCVFCVFVFAFAITKFNKYIYPFKLILNYLIYVCMGRNLIRKKQRIHAGFCFSTIPAATIQPIRNHSIIPALWGKFLFGNLQSVDWLMIYKLHVLDKLNDPLNNNLRIRVQNDNLYRQYGLHNCKTLCWSKPRCTIFIKILLDWERYDPHCRSSCSEETCWIYTLNTMTPCRFTDVYSLKCLLNGDCF